MAITKKIGRLPSSMVAPRGRDFFGAKIPSTSVAGRGGGGEEVDVVGIHIFFEIGLIRSLLGFYNHLCVFFLSLGFIYYSFIYYLFISLFCFFNLFNFYPVTRFLVTP